MCSPPWHGNVITSNLEVHVAFVSPRSHLLIQANLPPSPLLSQLSSNVAIWLFKVGMVKSCFFQTNMIRSSKACTSKSPISPSIHVVTISFIFLSFSFHTLSRPFHITIVIKLCKFERFSRDRVCPQLEQIKNCLRSTFIQLYYCTSYTIFFAAKSSRTRVEKHGGGPNLKISVSGLFSLAEFGHRFSSSLSEFRRENLQWAAEDDPDKEQLLLFRIHKSRSLYFSQPLAFFYCSRTWLAAKHHKIVWNQQIYGYVVS